MRTSPLLPAFALLSATLLAFAAPVARADSIGATVPGRQVLWLAADFGVSTDGSNNLTNWLDASGNGHDWLSGTGSAVGNDATLLTGQNTEPPANPANSVALVNFSGVALGGLILDHTGNPLNLTAFSIYVVANTLYKAKTGVNQDFITVYNPSGGGGYAVGTVDNDSSNTKFYTGSAGTNINTTNATFLNSQFNFIAATIDPTGHKILTTGAYGAGVRSYTSTGINYSDIQYVMGNLSGGGQPLFGDIAEMLIYDNTGLTAAQVASQETAIQQYLTNKYFTAP